MPSWLCKLTQWLLIPADIPTDSWRPKSAHIHNYHSQNTWPPRSEHMTTKVRKYDHRGQHTWPPGQNTWPQTSGHMTAKVRTHDHRGQNTWPPRSEHMTTKVRTHDRPRSEHMTTKVKTHDHQSQNTWPPKSEHMTIKVRTHDLQSQNTWQHMTIKVGTMTTKVITLTTEVGKTAIPHCNIWPPRPTTWLPSDTLWSLSDSRRLNHQGIFWPKRKNSRSCRTASCREMLKHPTHSIYNSGVPNRACALYANNGSIFSVQFAALKRKKIYLPDELIKQLLDFCASLPPTSPFGVVVTSKCLGLLWVTCVSISCKFGDRRCGGTSPEILWCCTFVLEEVRGRSMHSSTEV